MSEIRPIVIVGIGPQSQKTVQRFVRLVGERQGSIPVLLPVIVAYTGRETSFRHEREGVQYITLSCPVFDKESDWPMWLPPELHRLSRAQREGTRAWMRAALLQRMDDLQDFLLERIPRLLSFPAVEQLADQGFRLAGNSEIDIHIITDLGDPLGSGIVADVACATASVCHQVGLAPLVSGLLYLPNAVSPAPIEEALAYAALKEIEYYARGQFYVGDPTPLDRQLCGPAFMNNGCYLLDTVNEAGYTLQDEGTLIATVCEQIYAMTFLNLESVVREHRERRYQKATLRGKGRIYESFGLAIRYVPRGTLSDWAVARLGGEVVESILGEQIEYDTDQRVHAFVERLGLRAEALENSLRQTDVTQHAEKLLASLHRAGIKQLDSRARTILQTVREKHLPVLSARAKERGDQEIEQIQEAMSKEVQMTLEDHLAGGVWATLSFLDGLRDRLDELEAEVQQRVERHQGELSRSLGTVSEAYYAMRNVTMGTPPWPVALLSVLAALVVPLLYQILLIYRVILPQSATWALGASGILIAGVLGVLGFVGFRLLHQRRTLARQHVDMVRERFTLESGPLIRSQIDEIYDEMRKIIALTKSGLETLVDHLRDVRARFERDQSRHARRLEELTRPGPSRSAIDAEIAEHLYATVIPDTQGLLPALAQSAGPIEDWLARCVESRDSFDLWLYDQISRFGMQHLEQSADQPTVVDALTRNGTRLEPMMERMFERAYPLWNYDPRFLRRAKTQRLTFVGADTQEGNWSTLGEFVAEARPEAILHHTGDPSALLVLSIHQGVPLFALRRIEQYRNHYAETLWRGKLPVHTTHNLALAADLIPMRRRTRDIPATLFAVGLALDIIHRDPDGRYVAPRGQGKTIRLSTQKVRSVALMGMDGPTCREVQRRLDALVAREGPEAISARLEEYSTDVPGLEDWEVRGIVEFSRNCEREKVNSAHRKATRPLASSATRPL